jgi:hypothetical protein
MPKQFKTLKSFYFLHYRAHTNSTYFYCTYRKNTFEYYNEHLHKFECSPYPNRRCGNTIWDIQARLQA